ncbi:MAG: TIGR02587 family membrane protein [Saprospiraceae bacterium]|nr:TIGR02587 family membrane protein [Pyrinomonadaceae bacterium]
MPSAKRKSDTLIFFKHLARAYGGAILFSFPILMTMEVWWLGAYLDGFRLALFTLLTIPLLIGLSYYDGFEDTSSVLEDVVATFVAYAVGFTSSALLLYLFGVITTEMSASEVIGKISLQAITASLGAMFAQSLLMVDKATEEHAEERKRSAHYGGQLFLMVVGAVFLSMSVAPTEEMVLISFQMTYGHTVALALISLLLMHGFIYAVESSGHENAISAGAPMWSIFLRYTVVGYAMALLISFYILWTFGSISDMAITEQIKAVVVLGVPAAVGASASRIIL